MKKTLIALTLATLPVAASADVVLYGVIKGGVEVTRSFTSNIGDKGTSTKIVDYGSRIGFKGHEDLNNNLRAIWQLEQDVNIGGGNTGFSTRDSFIGLTGNFGTVKAGHLSTPVKDINGRLDQWEYDNNAAGLGIYTRTNAAVDRKVAASYETPNFAGFQAQAYVSPSDNNNNNNNSSFVSNNTNSPTDREAAVYGAKLGYENAGFFADVAGTYVKNSVTNAAGQGKDGYQAAANVGFENSNWLAGVGYQQSRYVDDVESFTGEPGTALGVNEIVKGSKEVVASAAYTINNAVRLKGSAAYGFDIKSLPTVGITPATATAPVLNDAKYVQGVVGADYLLSKRTALNGQVGYLELKDGNKNKYKKGAVGVGMSHKF
ncbi:porin [Alysiella crassa]|uniref:Porin n=1 Tax=Alysiella crassa TaxID=153491 RepID=A0A376BK23_9NEIS|nr:porin [Alysiella crassa]UOP07758.1 porin [Alysiella crassa]SSY70000.1 Porin [Alysiella crassa]